MPALGDAITSQNPGYVVIGDSMAGSRIEPPLLSRLTGADGRAAASAGLGLRVVVSGAQELGDRERHPSARASHLLSRHEPHRRALPHRRAVSLVARSRRARSRGRAERGRRARGVGTAVPRSRDASIALYEAPQARDWIEPAVNDVAGAADVRRTGGRARRSWTQLNERFGLTHLRPMDAADMQATEDREADFDALRRQVGPAADAARRARAPAYAVLRPRAAPAVGGRPPAQSPALQRYVAKLQGLRRGATARMFHDDTGDPQLTLDMYEDGDHLSHDGAPPLHRDSSTAALRPLLSVIFHSLDFVVFFVVVVARLLAAAAPRAERPAARRRATSSTATSIPGS